MVTYSFVEIKYIRLFNSLTHYKQTILLHHCSIFSKIIITNVLALHGDRSIHEVLDFMADFEFGKS